MKLLFVELILIILRISTEESWLHPKGGKNVTTSFSVDDFCVFVLVYFSVSACRRALRDAETHTHL